MGRADSLARAALLTRPPVAYIHRFLAADGWHDYELTYDQLERNTAWTARQLTAHGLQQGHRALLTFAGVEGPWVRPIADALRQLRVMYGTAEAAGWDHSRARYLNRQLAPRAVIGLSLQTAEALAEQGPLGELFARTALVLARPDAVSLLRSAGVDAAALDLVGPALGIECQERAGVHVDAGAWVLAERDGQPVISGAPGGPAVDPVPLPVTARVVMDICGCGSTDPRLVRERAG